MWASSLIAQSGSPVRESRPPGSVRGVLSNGYPYRDSLNGARVTVEDQGLLWLRSLFGMQR